MCDCVMIDVSIPSWLGWGDAIGGEMTLDDALAVVKCDDSVLLRLAGPAVLRLKLLEVAHVLSKPNLPPEIRAAAQTAARELRTLIAERPCVSLADVAAREKVLGRAPTNLTEPHRKCG